MLKSITQCIISDFQGTPSISFKIWLRIFWEPCQNVHYGNFFNMLIYISYLQNISPFIVIISDLNPTLSNYTYFSVEVVQTIPCCSVTVESSSVSRSILRFVLCRVQNVNLYNYNQKTMYSHVSLLKVNCREFSHDLIKEDNSPCRY